MAETIVEWFGCQPGNDCGYCKSKGSITHGMWAHYMSCETYENLLDRGWRRSGKYCYKPVMDKTCCPQYTIRCDATQIKLSKSQKKVLKRVNRFLMDGEQSAIGKSEQGDSSQHENKKADLPVVNECVMLQEVIKNGDEKNNNVPSSSCSQGKGADPDKPKCRKAKEIRRENKLKRVNEKPESDIKDPAGKKRPMNSEKTIEDFLNDSSSNKDALHKLNFSLVAVSNKELFDETFEVEFELYCKYQHIIHGDSMEELTRKQFRQFLVDGPLQYINSDGENEVPTIGLGAFHHQYFMDSKLIAVGVLDILPHCISSKYFFYDPDYMFLSLGTYSALREIYLVRSLNQECPLLKYYYMGFFIESCPKMKYKARYTPSYLLCPETYIWQPVERCIPKFTTNKYCRLEEDEDKNPPPPPDNSSALILNSNTAMMYSEYKKKLSSKMQLMQDIAVTEYVSLIGSSCNKILLYR